MVDVKKLAAEVLGVGESRVRISPEALDRLEEVTTKADVRALIKEGLIYAEYARGVSRGRWRELHEKRRKGRRRGVGSRRGSKYARLDPKEVWKGKIRAMRRYLSSLKRMGLIDARTWRELYLQVKGGRFDSVASLKAYLVSNNIIKQQR
ncbi:50S ribosomal protein L19e [Vulcanisaeta souniana]|uniref:Large ribosomal subunit protein eL19 n=1 Tax=Vulcanisaeta souniana JCM 11219 TaxID=1293586 RepID=A0A830EHV2_9CREN|nr:50S ribosomal protein L19e [Vulcanisaeta souniana]BDR93167.1 50S ribosomal protein L19e [Vulcanisaeta souniana JCM 11219]GGI78180.1 50S ribosomal protein L19e [Vulcanisaeta souniana JCM 11219]